MRNRDKERLGRESQLNNKMKSVRGNGWNMNLMKEANEETLTLEIRDEGSKIGAKETDKEVSNWDVLQLGTLGKKETIGWDDKKRIGNGTIHKNRWN